MSLPIFRSHLRYLLLSAHPLGCVQNEYGVDRNWSVGTRASLEWVPYAPSDSVDGPPHSSSPSHPHFLTESRAQFSPPQLQQPPQRLAKSKPRPATASASRTLTAADYETATQQSQSTSPYVSSTYSFSDLQREYHRLKVQKHDFFGSVPNPHQSQNDDMNRSISQIHTIARIAASRPASASEAWRMTIGARPLSDPRPPTPPSIPFPLVTIGPCSSSPKDDSTGLPEKIGRFQPASVTQHSPILTGETQYSHGLNDAWSRDHLEKMEQQRKMKIKSSAEEERLKEIEAMRAQNQTAHLRDPPMDDPLYSSFFNDGVFREWQVQPPPPPIRFKEAIPRPLPNGEYDEGKSKLFLQRLQKTKQITKPDITLMNKTTEIKAGKEREGAYVTVLEEEWKKRRIIEIQEKKDRLQHKQLERRTSIGKSRSPTGSAAESNTSSPPRSRSRSRSPNRPHSPSRPFFDFDDYLSHAHSPPRSPHPWSEQEELAHTQTRLENEAAMRMKAAATTNRQSRPSSAFLPSSSSTTILARSSASPSPSTTTSNLRPRPTSASLQRMKIDPTAALAFASLTATQAVPLPAVLRAN